jgi:hypothetical protein
MYACRSIQRHSARLRSHVASLDDRRRLSTKNDTSAYEGMQSIQHMDMSTEY